MPAIDYPEPVRQLVAELKQLPGIGPKSAERIAIWLMQQGPARAEQLSGAVNNAGTAVTECEVCGFFMSVGGCCTACDGMREAGALCVVEQPTDVLPLERSGVFRGHYHVLRGKISPLDDVGPEDLRIRELVERLREGAFSEVILALSADVEGEATANYLADLLSRESELSVTRLAQGIPAGGGLENADELTLMRALQGRVSV